MQYTNASNPRWAGADGSAIDLVVTFEGLGEVPFLATAGDIEEHGRDLFARASAGEFGPIAPFEPAPEPVPAAVSKFQAQAALYAAGLLDDVEAAVSAADRFVQLAWQGATVFERTSPTIAALGAAIGLSDADLDDLFREAAKIRA